MLGDGVFDATKKNLETRIDAEYVACDNQYAIAKRSKQLDYDAIHDSVHEMCRDTARHGAVLEGLFKRHFA